jgi:hypothetical protein
MYDTCDHHIDTTQHEWCTVLLFVVKCKDLMITKIPRDISVYRDAIHIEALLKQYQTNELDIS